MNHSQETLWRTYEVVNDWIKVADAKAAIILATNGILATILFTNLLDMDNLLSKNITLTLSILGILCGFASVIFSIKCLNPSTKVGEPNSLIYFAHIAQKYASAVDYENEITNSLKTDEQISRQIVHQVWANSRVAWKKYISITWATRFFSATILICVIGCLVLILL